MMRRKSKLRSLVERHKIATGITPVVLMVLATAVVSQQTVLLAGLWATLPVAILFVVAYTPESPGRHWFGTSLLLLAYAVLAVVTAALLLQTLGPSYDLRPHLVTVWVGLTMVSMYMRTWVLLVEQARDRRHLGGLLRRLFDPRGRDDQGVG